MGFNNREVEKKYVVVGMDFKFASRVIQSFIDKLIKDRKVGPDVYWTTSGKSTDHYWSAPDNLGADFIRIRDNSPKYCQLTLKKSYGGNNTNRVEIDIDCKGAEQPKAFLKKLLGKSSGKVTKRYIVGFIKDSHKNISVYQIIGDNRVFLEIEAKTLKEVNQLQKTMSRLFNLELESRSIYQIFIKDNRSIIPITFQEVGI